ncbi:hypothetical protein HY640_04290 [Candidatus Woesearchaeota archaeon]|nr:hypothetical protein [Candidatus Woesearchaeota archaeon]
MAKITLLETRSTIIRKLLSIGYKGFIKKKAAEDYRAGKITISETSKNAETSVWEMETYLISQGYKSEYSIEDLETETLQQLIYNSVKNRKHTGN